MLRGSNPRPSPCKGDALPAELSTHLESQYYTDFCVKENPDSEIMTENSNDRIVCDCTGTRRSKILELIKRGETTLERIEDITGANTGCSSCDADIQNLLDEHTSNTD